jgi:hypothetical protein
MLAAEKDMPVRPLISAPPPPPPQLEPPAVVARATSWLESLFGGRR